MHQPLEEQELGGSARTPAPITAIGRCYGKCCDHLLARLLAMTSGRRHGAVLSALWRQDGLLVNEIARYTGDALPAISRIIDRMTKEGRVIRRADPEDRRAAARSADHKGRALEPLPGCSAEIAERLLAGFSEPDTRTLCALLERVPESARRDCNR